MPVRRFNRPNPGWPYTGNSILDPEEPGHRDRHHRPQGPSGPAEPDQTSILSAIGDPRKNLVFFADGGLPHKLAEFFAANKPALRWTPDGTRLVYATGLEPRLNAYIQDRVSVFTLAYGKSLSIGPIRCRSALNGVTCRYVSGKLAGFRIARQGYVVWRR